MKVRKKGQVNCNLEWGQSSRISYTFVFFGTVTREGSPCANARVNLDLQTSSQGVITRTAESGDDGRYQIAVTVRGMPDQSSAWKIEAWMGSHIGEAAGRVILVEDQTVVLVDRPIYLQA